MINDASSNSEIVANRLALLIALSIFALTSNSHGQTLASCEASKDKPIAICFADKPLSVRHCDRPASIAINFHVARYHPLDKPAPLYYFTYQLLLRNGALFPDDAPANPFQRQYVLRNEDPTIEGQPYLNIIFPGEGDYKLRVTVHAEGIRDDAHPDIVPRETTFTAVSTEVHLDDKPEIRGLVVGITHYDNPAHVALDDLYHADADAKAVAGTLEKVFGAKVDLMTSDDGKSEISRREILDRLAHEAETQDLCGDGDWFVFYFSGHGIIGTTRRNNSDPIISHYLSTKKFDPAHLQSTAIRIPELATAISAINATNVLVMLDSCFSGKSNMATGPKLSGAPGKVQYVIDNQLVDPIAIGSLHKMGKDSDVLAFQQSAERMDIDERRALYLSASSADHQAEEGYAVYDLTGLEFIDTKHESQEQKLNGHGLYTFAILWNLLSQVPKNIAVPAILERNPAAIAPPGDCRVSFLNAHIEANADINKFGRRTKRDMQIPNVDAETRTGVPALTCTLPQVTGDGDAATKP